MAKRAITSKSKAKKRKVKVEPEGYAYIKEVLVFWRYNPIP